jgi:hypothetical protein
VRAFADNHHSRWKSAGRPFSANENELSCKAVRSGKHTLPNNQRTNVSQQYNKVIKRRRRDAYLKRRKQTAHSKKATAAAKPKAEAAAPAAAQP